MGLRAHRPLLSVRLAAFVTVCASVNKGVAQDPLLPPEGRTMAAFGSSDRWQIDPAYGGITAVARADGSVELRVDLDWRDPKRRSGVVWVSAADSESRKPELSDFSDRGVFGTLRCQGIPPVAFRACTGLRDDGGNVFWGRSIPVDVGGAPTTAGMYPELRFPLPQGFRSERFDPTRVAAVGIRLDVIDDKRRTFNGSVKIGSLRIVVMPDELRAQRNQIAERIGRENWLNNIKPPQARAQTHAASAPAASQASTATPIAEFCENVGVNYPWPVGFYAGVGRRPWNPGQAGFSHCANQMAADFEYLARHHVRLVRVFLFCDARTGIVAQDGAMTLDPFVLDDIRTLLSAARQFPSLRLAPVLFDFLIADGVKQEDSYPVGEHPDWIAEPAKRRALLDAIQPAIDLLCAEPQVAFVDLINEPEHAAAVGADDMWFFLRELAERIHRHPRRMACTVGSANATYAPFWLSTGIDFPTSHWFAKTDATHPLGDRSAALPVAMTIMTEIDPGAGVGEALTRLWESGFRGGLFWSLNAGDAYEFRGPPAQAFKRWVEQRMPR